MKILAILIILLTISSIINVYAQESRKYEDIEIPYHAFNAIANSPVVLPLQYKHMANFLVNIKNELVYRDGYDAAKAVIRLGDNSNDKFIELMMYGKPSNTLIVSLFTRELGYAKFYESSNGWSEDREIGVSFIENDKVSIHNGQRNIMDRLRIGEFTLDTLEVYGKDSIGALDNVIGGKIRISIISGNPLDNPISYVPAIAVAVIGVIVAILLKTKKR